MGDYPRLDLGTRPPRTPRQPSSRHEGLPPVFVPMFLNRQLPLLAGRLLADTPDRPAVRGGDVVGEEVGGPAQRCERVIHVRDAGPVGNLRSVSGGSWSALHLLKTIRIDIQVRGMVP